MTLFKPCGTCTAPETLTLISDFTEPHVTSMKDSSRRIVDLVVDINRLSGEIVEDKTLESAIKLASLLITIDSMALRANHMDCGAPSEGTCPRAAFLLQAIKDTLAAELPPSVPPPA